MRAFGRFTLWAFAILGGLFATLLLAVVAFTLSVREDAPSLPDNAVLQLDLTVAPAAKPGMPPLFDPDPPPDLRQLLAAIERARTDPGIKALSATVGGAGFSVADAQELAGAIRRFRESGKPAVAFAADLGALGDQMPDVAVATAFGQLWLQPSGGVGFSGMAIESPFFAEALAELDIEPEVGQRHEYKGGIDPLIREGFSPAVRESLTRVVDGWVAQLSETVAVNRGQDPAAVRGLVDAGPFLAAEAKRVGLVDELGYRDQMEAALDEAVGGSAQVVSPALLLATEPEVAGDGGDGTETPPRGIAVIYGVGPIEAVEEAPNPLVPARSFGPSRVAEALAEARRDAGIDGVLFRVDSPGGAYGPSDMVRREVRRLVEAGKPVVVSMGGVAASGGYFVSLDASRIVASPGTLTGSIGVYSGKLATRDLWERLGVRWDSIAAGENAGMWSFVDRFDAGERRRFDAMLDAIYEDFAGHVGRARGLDAAGVDRAARGRVWLGTDALSVGLVDALGGYGQALDELRAELDLPVNAPLDLRVMPEPKSPWERLIEWVDGGGGFDELVADVAARVLGERVERVTGDLTPLRALAAGPLAMPPVRVAR